MNNYSTNPDPTSKVDGKPLAIDAFVSYYIIRSSFVIKNNIKEIKYIKKLLLKNINMVED